MLDPMARVPAGTTVSETAEDDEPEEYQQALRTAPVSDTTEAASLPGLKAATSSRSGT